jgi:hypothetical protein
MEIVQLLQDWVGLVSLILTGIVWWFVKLNSDKIKANEQAKQEVQHTEQEKLSTEEKDFELDSRRVKVSEEVASETLEHLAETREENLKLLEDNYELRKAVVDLQFEMRGMKNTIAYIKEERVVICHFFCRKGKVCPDKDPAYGPFELDAATFESLKKIINDGKDS